MFKRLTLLIIFLLLSTNVAADHRRPTQRVHLDGAGHPMINSFETTEYKRQQKHQVNSVPISVSEQGCPPLPNGQIDPKCAKAQTGSSQSKKYVTVPVGKTQQKVQLKKAPVPLSGKGWSTPTSVIVNRPTRVHIDPNSQKITY